MIPGVTAAATQTWVFPHNRTVLTSDTFSGGDVADLSGRNTDALLGGSAQAWAKASTGVFVIGITSGGLVTKTTGTVRTFAFNTGSGDVYAQMKISTLPTTGSPQLLVRQDADLNVATYYRLRASGTPNISVARSVNGVETGIISGIVYAAGDTVGILVKGSRIAMVLNGAIVAEVTDTGVPNTNTRVGFRPSGGTSTGYVVDDFLVEAV